jgi:hypothetical protein
MRKFIVLIVALIVLAAAPVVAANTKPKQPKSAGSSVTLTADQFMALLAMIAERPAPVTVPGAAGAPGAAGKPGDKGERGERGEAGASVAGVAGAAGERGVAGERGADGAPGRDGRDGVGFAQGVVFLVNGACPDGSTVQGAQNRWTVYANDTSGRPWTTTGTSAQLFLSACQVN